MSTSMAHKHHIIRRLLPYVASMSFSLFLAYVAFILKRSGMLGVSLFGASIKSYVFYAGIKRDRFLMRLKENPELWRIFKEQGRHK
ncbi:hypothetical protein ACRAQ7_04940 [Erythrobacter sp. W53]|uniref:hypothetical protein n=1 Tax=Erythrobacter sp. W53 TaxID=3425947 RepID=UPI003D768FA5